MKVCEKWRSKQARTIRVSTERFKNEWLREKLPETIFYKFDCLVTFIKYKEVKYSVRKKAKHAKCRISVVNVIRFENVCLVRIKRKVKALIEMQKLANNWFAINIQLKTGKIRSNLNWKLNFRFFLEIWLTNCDQVCLPHP